VLTVAASFSSTVAASFSSTAVTISSTAHGFLFNLHQRQQTTSLSFSAFIINDSSSP
jgi:hypothetical protein